jgi:hypothetical protein
MSTPQSKGTKFGNAVLVALVWCIVAGIIALQISGMAERDARQQWRPPVEIQMRIVEGRFESETSGFSYRGGYAFTTTSGEKLYLGCTIMRGKGGRLTPPHDCLNFVPEELRGQAVRVGYLDPALSTGKASGDHLILKVWRDDRLLLTRPIDNTW